MTRSAWSLRNRLIALLATLSLVAWAVGSVWLYRSVEEQAGALFDAALVETAHAVFASVAHEGLRKDDDLDFEPEEHAHPERMFYQLRDRRGRIRYASPGAPAEPLASPEATGFTDSRADGVEFRVYTLREPRLRAAIHVGQRVADREALVRNMALRLLLPGVLVVLLLSAGAWIIVRRVTAPVVSYARAIDARAPTESGAVAADELPDELRPVGEAVNRLLERVDDALLHERTLTADAAHELRTPLSALRAQAQVALRSHDAAERNEALQALIGGVDRATRLVETVLALARLDASTLDRAALPIVALRPLVAGVVDGLSTAARASGRTIEVDVPDIGVPADRESLPVALGNLLENALRHARARVRISAHENDARVVLTVADDGSGMTPEQQARAFDRFYRGSADSTGAGLGLALVKRVAELHGGDVHFGPGLGSSGLSVQVSLPIRRLPKDFPRS
ncbi:MAG TPA: ATP-binding protein [Burkholderiaceae bacterium]|nr:ATP-binding protein [Burkholderiaceae bacterium]HQR69900.1 ATP-binding protein [Burkholderiaceae bacterium]